MTCPTCSGAGCPRCEGAGVVATVPEVTFAEACELLYREKQTGQPFHFLHGKPKLVEINGQTLRIVA